MSIFYVNDIGILPNVDAKLVTTMPTKYTELEVIDPNNDFNISKFISKFFADEIQEDSIKQQDQELNIILPEIKHITYCDKKGKEKVIVVFDDGTKVIKSPVGSDSFDLNVGVALCIAERLYGSKSAFHKMIKNKLPQGLKK